MPAAECYGDQHDLPRDEELQEIIIDSQGSSESSRRTSASSPPQDFPADPGLDVLINLPGQSLRRHIQPSRPAQTNCSANMAEQQDEPPPFGELPAEMLTPQLENAAKSGEPLSKSSSIDSGVALDVSDLTLDKERPDSVLPAKELATRTRSGSVQHAELPSTRSDLGSSLRITTSNSSAGASSSHEKDDSICASPTLSKHVIPSADVNGESLAPFEPLSPSTSSPKAERLPSIHQITSSLTELAEAATQEMPRQQQQNLVHHHSHSFGSATSQSPVLSNRPHPIAIQTSPQAYYPPNMLARSPTSTIGDSQYASPPAYASYYSHRRASAADGVPPLMPSLPTTSSSGDSYGGYLSSSTEGYSTNHTTPIDVGQASEYTPRPMLPPPPGMHAMSQPLPAPIMIPGPYKCDVPNCTAGTFQTQYLLNSHKNVHSQSRPHYCPVAGCPRSEGGKGFKRKNEMIRHGLVHNSPGYICPFCPEREHRYPRPDNLQRHVRVHHVNKDRDDNVLRDVLNQRTEGQGKTRRRRTNTGPMVASSL